MLVNCSITLGNELVVITLIFASFKTVKRICPSLEQGLFFDFGSALSETESLIPTPALYKANCFVGLILAHGKFFNEEQYFFV